MCDSCGCGDSDIVPVAVHERILANNERAARHNREHFHDHHVSVINLMGSPGAGKTAVLEATARLLAAALGSREKQEYWETSTPGLRESFMAVIGNRNFWTVGVFPPPDHPYGSFSRAINWIIARRHVARSLVRHLD